MLNELNNKTLNPPGRIIWKAIKDKSLNVTKSKSKFKQSPNNYDGFRDDDSVLLHQSSIADLFTKVSGRNVTAVEVGKILR